MAIRRGSSRTRGSAPPRRKYLWVDGPQGSQSLTSEIKNFFPLATQAILPGLTVVRLRGEVNLFQTSAVAAIDGFDRVALGICIVSEQSAAVAAAAGLPSPDLDMDWPGWMWHWSGSLFSAAAHVEPTSEGPASVRIVIDNKSMRIWKDSDVMVGVVAANGEVSTASLQATMNVRVLTKLP